MIKLHSRYLNIGTDLEYNDNLADTIMTAIDLGIYTFSFNLGNSRNAMRKRVEMEDLVMCMGLTTRFPMIVFSKIPSMYNLCGGKKILAWNGNDLQDTKTCSILKEIEYELYTLAKVGGSSIIELGAYRDKNGAIESIVKSINNMSFKLGYKLVLINSLDVYFNVGTDLHILQKVYNSISKHSQQYVNIALNIPYLFVNGLYDFRKTSEVHRLFKEFDKLFSNKYLLQAIILTDCSNTFGAKTYDYEMIGCGELWSKADDALYALIEECQSRNISILTEDPHDMDLSREMSEELFS